MVFGEVYAELNDLMTGTQLAPALFHSPFLLGSVDAGCLSTFDLPLHFSHTAEPLVVVPCTLVCAPIWLTLVRRMAR
jgi:hypothetical protein